MLSKGSKQNKHARPSETGAFCSRITPGGCTDVVPPGTSPHGMKRLPRSVEALLRERQELRDLQLQLQAELTWAALCPLTRPDIAERLYRELARADGAIAAVEAWLQRILC